MEDLWSWAYQLAEHSFYELKTRRQRVGDHYPVHIDQDVATVNGSPQTRKTYRFLVLLRARQIYGKVLGDDGADAGHIFEEFVTHAISKYLGCESSVRFGVAGGVRGGGLPNCLPDALAELAKRMDESEATKASGHGDYKADAIAWKSFDDGQPGQIVLICQATIAEREWIEKEPAKKWSDRRLISLLARPVLGVAFAETLSSVPTALLQGLPFTSIPFDRLRLLSVTGDDIPTDLLNRMDAWVNTASSKIPS